MDKHSQMLNRPRHISGDRSGANERLLQLFLLHLADLQEQQLRAELAARAAASESHPEDN